VRATSRRFRKVDPLASPDAVLNVLTRLREALPDIIPPRDKELVRLLRAARHIQRYQATDTNRGRPSRWRREDLLKVLTSLRDVLDRETLSHISIASFVDHYVRLLDFPPDVVDRLTSCDINLFEAEQLAKITAERLGLSNDKAKRARNDLVASHVQTKGSGERLRRRVNELLSVLPGAEQPISEAATSPTDAAALEDFDPYDATHLFWEQIKQLGFAFRDIRREDVTDAEIEELLITSEPVMAVLTRIQRRKDQRNLRILKF
jgi:hypothetical protein